MFCLAILPGPNQAVCAATINRIVVAADGSGDYSTIGEALESCRAFMSQVKEIYVKNGTYREKIHIDAFLTNIHLVGESAEGTIITYGDYAALNDMGTFRTWTLKISGDDITLENLTIENSAGRVGQAVALHVEGDRCKVIRCRIIGNQDTLYASGLNSRQYYGDCTIEGTTDFIFGPATALFDHCIIHSRKNSYITAANTPQGRYFGYVFRYCELTADEGVDRVYLGRPWRDHARVVFMYCNLGDHIVPEGWHNWAKPEREKTAFYAEYKNTGSGSDTTQRVGWSRQLTDREAATYTEDNIFRFCSGWMIKDEQ